MNILFVTYHFPPRNSIGAVRTGKTAKYLRAAGHEVTVVAAAPGRAVADQPVDLPADSLVYVRDPLADIYSATTATTRGSVKAVSRVRSAVLGLRRALYAPDRQVLWFPAALHAAYLQTRIRSFDVILASAWPVTSLLVARSLSTLTGLPWVAELRDLWADNHYAQLSRSSAWLDARLEGVVLRDADGLVTVSPEFAAVLSAKYDRPIGVIYTGHEDETARFAADEAGHTNRHRLRLVFTGRLYGERRDPSALFAALESLGDVAADIDVEFVGPDVETARAVAERFHFRSRLTFKGPVAYRQARSLQAAADVLLLVLWDQAGEEGVVPGKLFEYMGMRRPILVVAPPGNAAARLVTQGDIGFASAEPEALAAYLRDRLSEKCATGHVGFVPNERFEAWSTAAQTARLAEFLVGVARRPAQRI